MLVCAEFGVSVPSVGVFRISGNGFSFRNPDEISDKIGWDSDFLAGVGASTECGKTWEFLWGVVGGSSGRRVLSPELDRISGNRFDI